MRFLLLSLLFASSIIRAATPQDLMAQMLPTDLLLPNATALGLSAEQQQRLGDGLAPLQREMQSLLPKMRTANSALVALLSAAQPDETAVLFKYAELEAIEAQIKRLRLKMTLVAKSVLSAEQQQRAHSLRDTNTAPASGGGDTIPAKLQRVRDGLERLRREGRDVSAVRAKWAEFQQHAEAREHQLAMKALDEAIALLESPAGGKK
jgi:hypothetical protein